MPKKEQPTEFLGDFGGEPKGARARGAAFDEAVKDREPKAVDLVAEEAVRGPEETK